MGLGSIEGVRIEGVAAAVPKMVAHNSDFALLSETDRTRLIKVTGIAQRRVAPDGMCASDLCCAAAERLLSDLSWSAESIECLIFVSQTPDFRLPATSVILQDRLKLSKDCLAFDINLGCSGYVYGLSTAASIVSTLKCSRALLLVGDLATRTNSQVDRTAGPLFGDAGTATALKYCKDAPPIFCDLHSDGSGRNAIIMPGGGYRNPLKPNDLEIKKIAEGVFRSAEHAVLDGAAIFNFALREVPLSVSALLRYTGVALESVDLFVFHQANFMMNEQVRKKIGIPVEKHPYSLDRFGNTSCATLPLTMVVQSAARLTSARTRLMLAGFGVGLSWGTVLIETDRICCPELVEL